jgi:hypothetical protein
MLDRREERDSPPVCEEQPRDSACRGAAYTANPCRVDTPAVGPPASRADVLARCSRRVRWNVTITPQSASTGRKKERSTRRQLPVPALVASIRGNDTVLELLSRDKTGTLFAFGSPRRTQPPWFDSLLLREPPWLGSDREPDGRQSGTQARCRVWPWLPAAGRGSKMSEGCHYCTYRGHG